MADRSDFYFDQNVTQAELDQCFDDMENADRNLIADQAVTGPHATAVWGVLTGLEVTERSGTPDLNVEIADGVAYDEQGRRIPHSGGPTLLDLTTAVPGSDSRYVRVYAEFTRVLSDPRTDGLGIPVDYRQEEAVVFSFDLGTPAASPTKPALIANKVCLATILIATGATQILDANISDEPGGWGLAIPDRQEGGSIPHGRLLPTRRKIHYNYSPIMGGEEVINLGLSNHLQVNSGTIRMATVGSDSGNALMGEMASIYKAGEVRVGGNIQDGGGYWYSDPAGDEYGEPLQAINKYLSFDASAMVPKQDAASPASPHALQSDNNWFLDQNGGNPFTTGWQRRWLLNIQKPSSNFYFPLYVPLVGLPFRAQLDEVEFKLYCHIASQTGMSYGAGVYRRGSGQADVTPISGTFTPVTFGSTGNKTLPVDSFTPHLIRPDLYSYFAAFFVYTTATLGSSTDCGVQVNLCEVKYSIREASGEYYHPSL